MSEPVAICLVDGVGTPRVLTLLDVPGETIEFPHEGISSGMVLVKFDRSLDETDPLGRPVYRQRAPGTRPDLRVHYLNRKKGAAR